MNGNLNLGNIYTKKCFYNTNKSIFSKALGSESHSQTTLMNALVTYNCTTKDFVQGRIKKKLIDSIIKACKEVPSEDTIIEIKLLRVFDHQPKKLEKSDSSKK